MIAYISGTLVATSENAAIVDAGGIGYEIAMANRALSRLPQCGARLRILTWLQVRDDGFSLYGFLTPEEKDLFLRLVGVSGIGPKVALAALSTFEPGELTQLIIEEDVKGVSRIPGVGKKSASRIVLELKGSLEVGAAAQRGAQTRSAAETLAIETLLAMGFSPTEAEVALRDSPADADEATLVRYALKRIGA